MYLCDTIYFIYKYVNSHFLLFSSNALNIDFKTVLCNPLDCNNEIIYNL